MVAILTAPDIPIAFALGIAALCIALFEDIPSRIVFQRIVGGINAFSLLAILVFIHSVGRMMHGRSPCPVAKRRLD